MRPRGQAIPDHRRPSIPSCSTMPAAADTMSCACPFRTIDVGPITVAHAPARRAGADRCDEIKLSQGYAQREAREFANRCARHRRALPRRSVRDPDDDGDGALAGDNAGGAAAADRLLAIEPDNARALADQGPDPGRRLAAAGTTDQAAWAAARQLLVRAAMPRRTIRWCSTLIMTASSCRACCRRTTRRTRSTRRWSSRRATASCATSSRATSSSAT